ncbi:MAG: TIGR02099 family protein [Nitrosomonadales bacterium]|nr:TIGR02099 family protein [Nitrosomonadales bacterium]
MLNSYPVRLIWRSLGWLTRLIIVVSSTAAVLMALAIIALRYWLLPDIEQYHGKIEASLSAAIGNPVTIGQIQGDWQGLLPHLNFSDVRFLDERGQPALVLQRIDGSVSWMSLFTAELRLASLEIDRPELLIRRDTQGNIFIGNLPLSRRGGTNDLADWILHQANMVVRNGLIVWFDEQRNASPLVLQQVNLRIANLFRRHSFALRAIPPSDLATPLDVRGEFHGESFDNLGSWYGQIFTQLDYTDVTAWRQWLDLPSEFSRGRGALRGWLGVKDGKVAQITTDLDLRDVVTRLADDVPELVILELRGRAAWKRVMGGFEISTRSLALRLQNGTEFQPTDFYLRTESGQLVNSQPENGLPATGELRANLLQLESLASLAKFLPVEAGWRSRLEAYAPRGTMSNLYAQWQGTAEKLDKYKLKGHFENLAANQVEKMPGFSGLTVDVDGNETNGRLVISSHDVTVNAPGVMREPLSFTTVIGQAGWQRKNGELSVNVDNIAVANVDLLGSMHGSYRTQANTLGNLDLAVNLTRGDIRRAARYTPLIALDKDSNDWLNNALLAGHTEDFHLRIKGNLSDFPLSGNSKGTLLEIGGHAKDAVLEFDKNWPRIENISCELSIRGNRLEVRSPSSTLLGTRLHNVTVTLPDLMSKDLALEIKGEATAASNAFLEFIQKSPVRGYIDGFTDGISATGNSHLDLFTRIPLLGSKPVEVAGMIKVLDSDIDFGVDVPLLRNTRGELSFTEKGMSASGVSSEILGGPASINMQTADGGAVHAMLKGRINTDILRKLQPHPLLNYLHGSANWDADIRVVKKSAQVIVNSSLQGISSSLPIPLAKRADEAMAVRVAILPVLIQPKRAVAGKVCNEPCSQSEATVAEGQDVINIRLGNLFSARLMRRDENGSMVIKRGLVNFGHQDMESILAQEPSRSRDMPSAELRTGPSAELRTGPSAELRTGPSAELRTGPELRTGVWLSGNVPALSVEGWGGLIAGSAGPALPIAGANLNIDKLTGYGLSVSALHIDAAKRGEGWSAQLSSGALNGDVTWQPHGYEMGALIRARLNNLQWFGDEPYGQAESLLWSTQPTKAEPIVKNQADKPHPGEFPALEVAIENLQFKGKQIGRFEMVGHPEGRDWRLRRLNIVNPDGSLLGDGIWSEMGDKQQTQVNLVLDISDAGKILERSGYPNTVKNGSGRLAANMSWVGTPDEFDYATLNGTLKLDTGKGRFVKMDTGAAKLLSILSLQALPKRIALDFTDVFSEGFQFEKINGNAAINNGVLETQDFHIDGSSAKVTMKGSVNLNSETQNLSVRILPTLGDSVSLIGAFAISPAVGIGSLIVNKVLGDPLDKLASFEYNVSGTWNNPNVVKVGGVKPKNSNQGE